MRLGKPANSRTRYWIWGIAVLLILLYSIAFRNEIRGMLILAWDILTTLLGFPFNGGDEFILRALNVTFFNCFFGFLLVFILWLGLISQQALLPVSNLKEIYRTAFHLVLYIFRRHGQAVFIKDGKMVANQEEFKRQGRGVIVVDFNSAVVLQERESTPGCSQMLSLWTNAFLDAIGLADARVTPRVAGPGIVFTRPAERIRGIVDLRKQFRIQPKVSCYTREGIELTANILTMFNIGEAPEVLEVAYDGLPRAENLRVLTFKPVDGKPGYLRLTGIADELDDPDRREIHSFERLLRRTGGMEPYEKLPKLPIYPVFNPDRVFAAVFAQARSGEQAILPWTDLPTRVAAGFYRDILATINYDDLYDIGGNGNRSPLLGFKRKLRLQMRNNGVLSFRLISLKEGGLFVKDAEYQESDLLVSEVRPLTNSKMLRDRGIKITFASFGDPLPVSDVVYQQRLDTWRATWDKERESSMAGYDLRAQQVWGKARAEAQEDLWFSLSRLFEQKEFSNEALALRILEAMENAVEDPKTRQLLPETTMELMRSMNILLSPRESISNGRGSRSGSPAVDMIGGGNTYE